MLFLAMSYDVGNNIIRNPVKRSPGVLVCERKRSIESPKLQHPHTVIQFKWTQVR